MKSGRTREPARRRPSLPPRRTGQSKRIRRHGQPKAQPQNVRRYARPSRDDTVARIVRAPRTSGSPSDYSPSRGKSAHGRAADGLGRRNQGSQESSRVASPIRSWLNGIRHLGRTPFRSRPSAIRRLSPAALTVAADSFSAQVRLELGENGMLAGLAASQPPTRTPAARCPLRTAKNADAAPYRPPTHRPWVRPGRAGVQRQRFSRGWPSGMTAATSRPERRPS